MIDPIDTIESARQSSAWTSPPKKKDSLIFHNVSKKRIEILVLVSVGVVVLLAIAVCLTVGLARLSSNPQICTSKECLTTASAILFSMDEKVNPCKDFYQFSCGNFKAENPAPDPFYQNSWFNVRNKLIERNARDFLLKNSTSEEPIFDQARMFLKSCLNQAGKEKNGMTTFLELLNKTELPMDPLSHPLSEEEWLRSLAKVRRYAGISQIIGVEITISVKNSSQWQITFEEPGAVPPVVPWLLNKPIRSMNSHNTEMYQIYKSRDFLTSWETNVGKMMNVVLKAVGAKYNQTYLDEASYMLFNMRTQLYALMDSDNITKITLNEIPDEMTVNEFQSYIDGGTTSGKSKLNISSFIEVFLEGSEFKFDAGTDKVLVHQKLYFKLLAEYLEEKDNEAIGLFIWWSLLESLAPHVNEELWMLKRELYSKFLITPKTRSSECFDTVGTLMSAAFGYFYMLENKNKLNLDKVENIVENIRNAFVFHIMQVVWMDEETKKASVEKLRSIKSFIGFPQVLNNPKELILNITFRPRFYLDNLMQVVQLAIEKELKSLTAPVNISKEFFNPMTINAFFSKHVNLMMINAGILQFPFFNLGTESLNYGALGFVIAHELTHGFDNIGKNFDKDGNVSPWWPNEVVIRYNERAECYKEQYSKQTYSDANLTVDGKLTLNENIADSGGMEIAYTAFKSLQKSAEDPIPVGLEKFTNDQIFFMSFANIWCSEYSPKGLQQAMYDEHSPHIARVNVVLQNFPPFHDAWNCTYGSEMNPRTQCILW